MDGLGSLLLAVLALDRASDPPESDEVDWFEQLDALGRGDVTALARLRRVATTQLMRMGAYRHQDAWDDFAQEVVIRVWRAHRDGKIREPRAVPAFLRTTTRNAFVDWTRSHHREVDLPDEDLDRERDGDARGPALDPGLQLALRGALDELEERHRDVVRCLYLEGLSYEETAETLGRPRGTINRLQREAIMRLRERLLGDAS
ncbi:MAG: sigma-70 family RNA polymerase sigma factor [Spirochaetaceae bacterium]|nr:sigma-70 family RNA polymerase sigma factor [Spirochaetaceae bacterium]HPG25142.1 sigma-70 family RNA polymerase sigma factor [Myxococcota bacterium]